MQPHPAANNSHYFLSVNEPCLSTPSMPESSPESTNSCLEHGLQLERQAVRMLDYTILPFITLFYLASFLDRSNIGNARVAGLQKDLHLTDKQYQICLVVPFGPLIATELPASLLLKKIGPRLLLSTVVIVWGIMATLQGFVTSYASLITVRAFLGLVEGPMAPGILIYLSSFYTRKELAIRIAIFFSSVSLSGAFSGLLAAAIENMDGIGGRPGWSWIFILEGLFTFIVGILGFFFIPSTPHDCQFLTEYQKELIIGRLEKDRPSLVSVDKFSFKEVIRSAASPHVIIVIILTFMVGMMGYGLALFLPSIVNELGFGRNATQLLSVGPFAAAFFVTLTCAYISDRYASRGILIVLISLLAVAGFALFLRAEHKFTSYGALYLMAPGVFGSAPVILAWLANNSEPHYRRATSFGLAVLVSTTGGILSTWSFPSKEGPKFHNTTVINLIFSILLIVGTLTNMAYLSWKNEQKKRPGVRAKLLETYVVADKEGNDDGGLNAWIELGDRHPDFVYTL